MWQPSAWTRLNRRSPTLSLRSQQPREADEEEEGVGGAEEEEIVVEEAELRQRPELKVVLRPSIKGPNTLTFQMEIGKGAVCISNTGNLHTFVPNPPLVPGKTSSFQDLQSETVTSSARLIRQ